MCPLEFLVKGKYKHARVKGCMIEVHASSAHDWKSAILEEAVGEREAKLCRAL
jgi:hypothetical protein